MISISHINPNLPNRLNIADNCCNSLSPPINGSPNNNSPIVHPMDHISILNEYLSLPNNNSGARYHKVTTIGVKSLQGGYDNVLANPKSANLNIPE
jgi:hypothetical protein